MLLNIDSRCGERAATCLSLAFLESKKSMKLLDEIVDLLSDEKGSLNQAMLKTKVLLHRLGNEELAVWVNGELNGYKAGQEVPQYRVVGAQVFGNVTNGVMRHLNFLLPVSHLSDVARMHLQTEKLRHALVVLEDFARKPGRLVHKIPPEFNGALGEKLSSGYDIESAWSEIDATQVVQVLTEIRSRLLDFVLGLQGKLDDDVTDADLKQEAAKINSSGLFAQTIFGGNTTFGNNTTFVLGHGNSQQVTNTVIQGDFNSLANKLKEAGVADEDVASLELAIRADQHAPELKEKNLGPSVRAWMHGMMGKAINLAWQVEVNVAGGLLTAALQTYYFS